MDDCIDDIQSTRYVTDTDTDQDSLDERIDSEQRLKNHQLWASFQNAASCITKLYKDKAQHQHQTSNNLSTWVSFQTAASNMATLYKDCIDSQRKFARIGYKAGKKRKMRELTKLLKKHKIPTKVLQTFTASDNNNLNDHTDSLSEVSAATSVGLQHYHQNQQQHNTSSTNNNSTTNNVASILNVNQLNLDCDDLPSHSNSMQAQPSSNNTTTQSSHYSNQLQQSNLQILLGNTTNEDQDLITFQQALAPPTTINRVTNKPNHQFRRPCSNSSGYLNSSRTTAAADQAKTEEERLFELNQFLTEEYNRHVGSRKRTCSNLGGDAIKRFRE